MASNSHKVTTPRGPLPLMTIETLSDYLQVPVSSIHRWRRFGTGPVAIKVGKGLRWRREDVEAWLAENETTGGEH